MRLFLILLLPLYLLSYSKVALVIGNKSYSSQTVLQNPIKDAKMIRDRLQAMDFEVLKVYDGDMEAIDKKLIEFGRMAKKAEVAVIFYAGHGIGYGGKNYLIPINTQDLSVDNIQRKLVGVSELQKKVAKASSFGVVFFDACRSAYFTDAIEGINSRGNNRALVPPTVSSRSNILVSFSTQAGTIAKDDVGGEHSPYAIALDEKLELSKDIRLVVGSVGERVAQLTQNKQTPISRSSLGGREYKLISAKNTASSKWITPTNSQCKWGAMDNRVCSANWREAKKICSALGGRLPTINELKGEVTRCGGENTTYGDSKWKSIRDKNIANKSYQSCYKNNGFSSSLYWSSTTVASNTNYAWVVYFDFGNDNYYGKASSNFVRCVRAGQ